MKLDVRERLVLLSVLPAEGNFVTLKVVRKLRDSLSFSEEEIKEFKFVHGNNQVTWNNTVEQSRPIEIGTQAKTIIQDALNKLDKEEKLREEHFTLCVKFLGKTDA